MDGWMDVLLDSTEIWNGLYLYSVFKYLSLIIRCQINMNIPAPNIMALRLGQSKTWRLSGKKNLTNLVKFQGPIEIISLDKTTYVIFAGL